MTGQIASPELIGRESELETIARALDDADAGQGRVVLVGGEAGIGKSRVLAEALRAARAAGALVLQGGCIGLADAALPFAPIVEAVRPLIRDAAAVRLRMPEAVGAVAAGGGADVERTDAPGGALRGVAAELGLLVRYRPGAMASAELRPEWARSQMYEAFLELLRGLAADRPVVLAIEDLHWADESTRELLAFLVRNARSERLLLLVTFRSDELHRRHPLLFWLVEVDRAPHVERLELARLHQDAVARQLAGILGRRPDRELVQSIFGRSEGNPFFAEELLAAGGESGRLPPTLREVLAARLAHVSEPTLRLLGVAAIVGRSVEHGLLAEVAELGDRELDDALQEAVAAQLLVADEDARNDRYAFRHALLAEAAAETILPGRRRRLHANIALALTASDGTRRAEEAGHLAEIAHHWFEARELERAFEAGVRAAHAALASGAFAEAARQCERAVELWDVVSSPEAISGIDKVELLRRSAQAAQLSGDYTRAAQLLREAIAGAEQRGEPIRAGLLLERLGRSLWTAGNFDQGRAAYRRATELVPDEPPSEDRSRVLAGYAQVLMLAGHHTESRVVAERALELARTVGVRQLEGHVLCTLGVDIVFVGDADVGIDYCRQALAIAEEVQDHDDVGRAYACLGSILELAGRREESISLSLEGARRLRELGMVATYAPFVEMNAASDLVLVGRWDEALELARGVQDVARGTAQILMNQTLAQIHTLRGEPEPAERALRETIEALGRGIEAQFNAPNAATHIDYLALTNDVAGGRRVADEILPLLAQTEDGPNHARVLVSALRLEASAGERAAAVRDRDSLDEAARRAVDLLASLRGLLANAPVTLQRHAVGLAVAIGEGEAARLASAVRSSPALASGETPLADVVPGLPAEPASTIWRRAHAIAPSVSAWDDAYVSYRLAEALLGERADRDEAAALLAAAHAIASRLRARPLRQSIELLASRARVRLPAEEPADGGPTVPAPEPAPSIRGEAALAAYGLSGREIEVLRLLAAGLTNRQIGEALFISESTAGVHVSHILGKLGVAGRVEAATIATKAGLNAGEPGAANA